MYIYRSKMLTMPDFPVQRRNHGAAMATDLLDHDAETPQQRRGGEPAGRLRGKVVLIVNTASKCAFTGKVKGWRPRTRATKTAASEVLGFPSNDFGSQEPGSEQQIQDFCRLTYSVKFLMFAKTEVKKGKASPLFEGPGAGRRALPEMEFSGYLDPGATAS